MSIEFPFKYLFKNCNKANMKTIIIIIMMMMINYFICLIYR